MGHTMTVNVSPYMDGLEYDIAEKKKKNNKTCWSTIRALGFQPLASRSKIHSFAGFHDGQPLVQWSNGRRTGGHDTDGVPIFLLNLAMETLVDPIHEDLMSSSNLEHDT